MRAVAAVSVDDSLLQRQHSLRMLLVHDNRCRRFDGPLRVQIPDRGFVGGPLGCADFLSGQILGALDGAVLFDQQLRTGQENGNREIHGLLASDRVGGGPALDVDGAVGHERNPGFGIHGFKLHLQRFAQFFLQGELDFGGHVDAESDMFVLLIEKTERNRPIPDAHDELPPFGYCVQSPLRKCRNGKTKDNSQNDTCRIPRSPHVSSPFFKLPASPRIPDQPSRMSEPWA